MSTGKMLLPLVCKLVGYHPGCHPKYNKYCMMHVTRMISVIQKSLKLVFYMQIPGFTGLREDFLIFFL